MKVYHIIQYTLLQHCIISYDTAQFEEEKKENSLQTIKATKPVQTNASHAENSITSVVF